MMAMFIALKNVKRKLERENIEQIRQLFGKKTFFGRFESFIVIGCGFLKLI
jgi:hypothetical protein